MSAMRLLESREQYYIKAIKKEKKKKKKKKKKA